MTENKGFHAHIYYDAETKPKAAKLRETLAANFAVRAGDLSDEPRGPTPDFAIRRHLRGAGISERGAVADAQP